MDPRNFDTVQQIVAAAIELPPSHRAAFVETQCGGDAELLAEVKSLLTASDRAGPFFDDLADRAGLSALFDDASEESMVGRTVSHFEVTGELGSGGMGVVYRARDLRLDRDVALKVMPGFLADDARQLARFQEEARVLARVNAPGIGAIYDLVELDGRTVLVLELVEGETLHARMKRERLPLQEALLIARRVAAALEAAHAAGIVHRDLKPSNVMIRPDGEVKVLDFGIAKGLEQRPRDGEVTPSSSAFSLQTQVGMIMGTASYMSPEQARGRAVDPRSDIWSFGVLLFEMLAGRRPFVGEDTAQVLARILEGDPDWAALPAKLPRSIVGLLERCLSRDRTQRLQAIGEARIIIDRYLSDPATEQTTSTGRGPSWWWVASTVIAAAVAGWLVAGPRNVAMEARNLVLALPNDATGTRMSPDGGSLFYNAGGQAWVWDLNQPTPRRLTGAEGALNPFWTGNSQAVVFRRDDKLWLSSVEGGGARIVCDLPPGVYTGGTWIEGDTILFALPQGLYHVPAGGGTPVLRLARDVEREASFREPFGLPGGGFLFAVARDGRIEMVRGEERTSLLQLEGTMVRDPSYSPPGHLVFRRMERGGEIWAAPFSLPSAEITGDPFLIEAVNAVPTVSTDGSLAYQRLPVEFNQLTWFDRDGRPLGSVSEPQLRLSWPAISPDGSRAVVSALEGGRRNLWIHDLTTGSPVPFTTSLDERHRYPFWSRDGAWIGFNINTALSDGIGVRPSRGEPTSPHRHHLPGGVGGSFSPDGRSILYHRLYETTGSDLRITELEEMADRPFVETPQHEGWARVSPDGTLVAYEGGRTGFPNVMVRRFPTGRGLWIASTDTGRQPRWSPDGRSLYFWEESSLMVVDVGRSADGAPLFSRPRVLVEPGVADIVSESYDVAPDGRLLLVRRLGRFQEGPPSGMVMSERWAEKYAR